MEDQTRLLRKLIDIFVCDYVCRLNSTVECIPYHLQLSPENALQLIQQYPAAMCPQLATG